MKKIFSCNKFVYFLIDIALPSFIWGQSDKIKPNFLVIQCDQISQKVIGAYGASYGITSVIDEYAKKGIVFTNAYVGCPLSQPSRAGLWTGLMPHQTNVKSNSSAPLNPVIPDSIETLGDLFTLNGYEAVHFGKTHDMRALRGFVHFEPIAEPFTDKKFFVNQDSYLDIGTCKDAVNYLKKDHQKPFICIVDFQNPHNICGFVGANEFTQIDSQQASTFPPLPPNFEVKDWNKLPISIQYLCCTHRRLAQASHWTEENYRYYLAAYLYYIKLVMAQIEQVVEALNTTQAKENTVIIFLADHGDGMAAHRLVTKSTAFYEEITNVPFIISGPGIQPRNQPVTTLVSPTTDLLPTLCELAGIKVPSSKPGISLLPTLSGHKQIKKHQYVVSEWYSEYDNNITPGRMIRSGKYKYIHYLEDGGEELYNLFKDPGETENLAFSEKHKPILEKYRKMLNDYLVSTNDNYRQLEIKVDRGEKHKLGYYNHKK